MLRARQEWTGFGFEREWLGMNLRGVSVLAMRSTRANWASAPKKSRKSEQQNFRLHSVMNFGHAYARQGSLQPRME
jgi:hypothetical protein